MENVGSGFAGVKQAFITYFNTVQKYEAPFEAELSSAPANVQAAGKGIFAFFNTLKTDVANSTSLDATRLIDGVPRGEQLPAVRCPDPGQLLRIRLRLRDDDHRLTPC